MAYSYTYVSATTITTPPINSTKVIVVANVACYANINGPASLSSNVTTIIPAGVRSAINMQGVGNTLSLLPTSGTAAMSVTQVGNVAPSGTATAVAGGGSGNTYTNG